MSEPDKMKQDTRTKPTKEDTRTKNVPDPDKMGQQSNVKQNTHNQGYQQDR